MYPEALTTPMKKELTSKGFLDLTQPSQVEELLNKKEGTILLVVNSVCGCAAGTARPGVLKSLEISSKKPDVLATVFAGVDKEATAKAREYFAPYPPSSPSIAFFKNGELVHFIERHHIEGRSAEMIAEHLAQVYAHYC
ncbi:MAG: BrxA/BrxB family bacilliredoxin [Cytophagales bacterium]|nr:BrxA/BrxB family bacilliredoxin [Cytophagales bacterium]MDW8384993.1 BrxA/BrxB family bacilliredoxin [Flammeovirgaceae bacterium]